MITLQGCAGVLGCCLSNAPHKCDSIGLVDVDTWRRAHGFATSTVIGSPCTPSSLSSMCTLPWIVLQSMVCSSRPRLTSWVRWTTGKPPCSCAHFDNLARAFCDTYGNVHRMSLMSSRRSDPVAAEAGVGAAEAGLGAAEAELDAAEADDRKKLSQSTAWAGCLRLSSFML